MLLLLIQHGLWYEFCEICAVLLQSVVCGELSRVKGDGNRFAGCCDGVCGVVSRPR